MQIGSIVKVTADKEDLPMPQYLYSGHTCTVKDIEGPFYYVVSNDLLSGQDEGGVPFLREELTLIS